jgi:RsiW-degrading membrane proteinase PrsW (M82 family)
MSHEMRARVHQLTRNRQFLIRTSLTILFSGLIVGCGLQGLGEWGRAQPGAFLPQGQRWLELREIQSDLARSSKQRPREVMHWLRKLVSSSDEWEGVSEAEPTDLVSFLADGLLHSFPARDLIEQHTAPGAERDGLIDFIIFHLAPDEEEGLAAMARIRSAANAETPVALMNELLAHISLSRDEPGEALEAFIREGQWPEAATARESAFRLAVELRNREVLEDLKSRAGWIDEAPPWLQSRVGALTGDLFLQWRGIVAHQLSHTRWGLLLLALFSASLWYTIFTQRSPLDPMRWIRPTLPLIAGICSVWPTLMILAYQEYELGMSPDAPFPKDLWYYLAGVGLREELSKLTLFGFFVPWLVWRRDAGLAVLTGAFVGLGFAMEENIQYFTSGGAVAWTRFVSANFMHASMTAIAGHALYEMIRTRFGHAEKFVVTFLAVVAAHGLYDYSIVANHEMAELMGISIFSIIILAALAQHFFDLLNQTTRVNAGMISPGSIFLIGSALLIAIMFVMAGNTADSLAEIGAVGTECVNMAPVAYLFWKKFEVR